MLSIWLICFWTYWLRLLSDYPKWPASDPLHPTTVPYSPHYTSHLSPSQTLTDVLQYFCISDCFYGYCSTHDCTPSLSSQDRPEALLQTNHDHFLHLSRQLSQIRIYITQSQPHVVNIVSSLGGIRRQYAWPFPSFLLNSIRDSYPIGPQMTWASSTRLCDTALIHLRVIYLPSFENHVARYFCLPLTLIRILIQYKVATKRHQWLSTQSPLTTSKQNFSRKYTTSTKIEFAGIFSLLCPPPILSTNYTFHRLGPGDIRTKLPMYTHRSLYTSHSMSLRSQWRPLYRFLFLFHHCHQFYVVLYTKMARMSMYKVQSRGQI